MRYLICVLVFCATAAVAKPKATPQYQDAVLVSFRSAATGQNCSSNGSTTGTVSDDGKVNADSDSNTSCSDVVTRFYTLKVGDNTFTIKIALSKKQAAIAYGTIGWGRLFMKNDVLQNQLPGLHVLVRSDGSNFYVKIGTKESLYSVVSAQ